MAPRSCVNRAGIAAVRERAPTWILHEVFMRTLSRLTATALLAADTKPIKSARSALHERETLDEMP
jgi:hypothetical protein